jgi:cytochrome c
MMLDEHFRVADVMRLDAIRFSAPHAANTAKPLRGALLGAMLLAGMAAPPCAGADLALGEYLSGECMGCHQLSGKAVASIPGIAGRPEAEIAAALFAYKSGMRENLVMRNVAGRLTEEEIAALAAFFASQKP